MQGLFCCLSTKISFFTVSRLFFACLTVRIKDNEENSLKVALKNSNQERGYNMATKFYLAEIPDDFPATNVKFENMTKPLLAIPAKINLTKVNTACPFG